MPNVLISCFTRRNAADEAGLDQLVMQLPKTKMISFRVCML